jgi:hypothetical protein
VRYHLLFTPTNPRTIKGQQMKLTIIGASALVAAVFATPALAQAVIEDPGYCAQFYPNANCDNLGPGNPYTDGGYWRKDRPSGQALGQHRRDHHQKHRG